MKGIIYKYTFSDGKVYVGQTRRYPERRKQEHLDTSAGPRNKGFWEAYERLGEPKYEVLFEVERENEDELVYILNMLESLSIAKYEATNPKYGYNIKKYGNVSTKSHIILNKKFEELFNIISSERLKLYNSALKKIWTTKEPLTEEEKFLVREKYRDVNIFQSSIDKFDFDILSNNDDGLLELIADDALPYIKFIIESEISEELSNYIGNHSDEILNSERSKNVIVQLDSDGNIIKEYKSFNEICQEFKVARAENVKNVLNGKQKTAYGYSWKYKKDI